MIKKILKGIFLLLLIVLFGIISWDIPYTCISLLAFSTISLIYTKRIKLKLGIIFLCLIGFTGWIYFRCPADRPWNKNGHCYSCQDERSIDIPFNQEEAHKKVCPNRFLQAQNCCGNEYYTSMLKKPTVFSTVFCRCVANSSYILEIGKALEYSFYFLIWTLILKLTGFLDKRKTK